MYVKIMPRKTTDRGGYLAMPLRVNIPEPKDKMWKLTKCPNCGAELEPGAEYCKKCGYPVEK